MQTVKEHSKGVAEEKIDLLAIAKHLLERKMLIIKIVGVFLFIGVMVAFLAPNEFTASSTFLPQTENPGGGGNLRGLASLAGINLRNGTSNDISPALYDKVTKSIKFKRELLEVPISLSESGPKVSYEEYYNEYHSPGFLSYLRKYTIGLPRVIWNSLKAIGEDEVEVSGEGQKGPEGLIRISSDEVAHFRRLENQLQIILDDREGVVELRFEMPDPRMAAEMAKASEERLQQEIIDYKIRSASVHLTFIENQFEEKRRNFLESQQALARFRDRNQNIVSAVSRNQLEQLEADYNFSFGVYTEMANELEQAKVMVSKNTPVFTILNPVSIPIERSAPNKIFILLIMVGLGLFVSLAYLYITFFLEGFREQWKNTD